MDGETSFAQPLCQKSRRLLFILDHQNSHKRNNLFSCSSLIAHRSARAPLWRLKSMSDSKRKSKTTVGTQETDLSRPGGRAITSPESRNVVAAENRQ